MRSCVVCLQCARGFCYVINVSINHHNYAEAGDMMMILISREKPRLRAGTGPKSWIYEESRSTPNLMILCWVLYQIAVFWVPLSYMCVFVSLCVFQNSFVLSNDHGLMLVNFPQTSLNTFHLHFSPSPAVTSTLLERLTQQWPEGRTVSV